jgi:hypothetical protein
MEELQPLTDRDLQRVEALLEVRFEPVELLLRGVAQELVEGSTGLALWPGAPGDLADRRPG